jgi:3-oxoacyl-[acyl-carrier-protein] synthase-3
MRFAEIVGWGKALPPTVLTNDDLSRMVDTSDEWITTRTGIKERRISHVGATEMAVVAARRALAAADMDPAELDLVVNATCTPETLIPASASHVQARLAARNAGAMDLNANCSGFIYGLVTVSDMIKAGSVDNVLLVGVEKLSYLVDYTDRSTCVLFGDGAGAVVLTPSDHPVGVLSSELGVDGEAADILCVPEFGTAGRPGRPDPRRSGIYMEGQEVFRRAVTKMGEASVAVVEKAGWELTDVDLLIPHQANLRIIDATARRMGLPASKVFVNIHAYGNTSAATIPVAITEALEQEMIRPGDNLVLAAFGGGLTWAAAAVKWGERTTPLSVSDAELPPATQTVWELLQPNFEFYGLPEKLRD